MKMSKNIVLLSITIITLITLVAIATYSYFTAAVNVNNKITTNVKMPLRSTFAVSGGGALMLNITREDVASTAINQTKEAFKDLIVTLTGEPGTTCSYNIYYKDTSSNGNYVYSHTSPAGPDFMFNIFSATTHSLIKTGSYKLLSQTSAGTPKITKFNETKLVITIPDDSTSATDNIRFHIYFVNVGYDQSALAGKTFKGEVYIDDVSCT